MALYQFTGNPFVDTGLCVVAHVIGKQDAGSIGIEDLRAALNTGEIAQWNSRLKSFTMIFGTNGPLMQSGYRHIDRCGLYTSVLENILDEQMVAPNTGCKCELCGTLPAIDISKPFDRALKSFGLSSNGQRVIGRDLMPMSGSPGNCAQSLPGSTQPVQICGRCLVAVNFLPLGSRLINGRLAIYECANQPLAYKLVGRIVKDNTGKLRAGLGKIETPGGKQRPESVIYGLVDTLHELDPDDNGRINRPLFIWLYTNSGQSTDCAMVEIPGYAISFLSEAIWAGFRKDIEALLMTDTKLRYENQLLQAIASHRPYSGCMPRKSGDGTSLRFAQFYLNRICRVPPSAFMAARAVAGKLDNIKECNDLKKDGSFNNPANRAVVRRIMADMAEAGELTFDQYAALFPTMQHHPIRVAPLGWEILRLHLCKLDQIDETELEDNQPMKTVHPKIAEASQLYFNSYIQERGLARFKADILNRFARGDIGVSWLRNTFAKLAEKYPGFTYGEWDDFVCDENGKPQAHELLFQMRLCLANLYRECMKESEEGTK